MQDKWDLLRDRITAGIETVDHQDKGKDQETHARYRGMVAGLQSVLDWMRMSEQA